MTSKTAASEEAIRQEVSNLICEEGLLNHIFKDTQVGKDFMYEYLMTLNQNDWSAFYRLFIDQIIKEPTVTDLVVKAIQRLSKKEHSSKAKEVA